MTRMYERLSDKSINKYKMKMQIIENNIYGVDIQPIAIEIALENLVIDNSRRAK